MLLSDVNLGRAIIVHLLSPYKALTKIFLHTRTAKPQDIIRILSGFVSLKCLWFFPITVFSLKICKLLSFATIAY